MSEDLEAETTEDGYTVDENGEILADPADVPVPPSEQEELENPAEGEDQAADSPDQATGREVLDFLLGAQEAAALVSDILRRKITVPAFRQLVMDGHAPVPEPTEADKKPGFSKWSMMALRNWATAIVDEEDRTAAAEAWQEEIPEEAEEPRTDFLLAARDAAGFLSEALGRRISTASFRQLVIDRDAPAADRTTDGTAKWSMVALRAWAQAVLAAEAEAAAQIDPEEEAAKERNAFAGWVRERLHRFESHDDRMGEWCPQWWDHPEAVDRFHALWLAYMAAEAEGELSGWWVNHWDRHFAFLFSKSGVFSQCAGGNHKEFSDRRRLSNDKLPADWLPYPDRVPQKEQKES
ncbi:DUF4913 domain-containing protein (plasmid) [Arthrobacter sp. KN11-1C]|uniref:DUF4913 domain-containing protein n=1 Tax=Arthrobacter sp. KN11-1C TaxID=3445774 RepID=UPI003F9FE515